MNKFHKILFFILLVIVLIMYILKHVNRDVHQESFIPRKIKEMYKPYTRNIRIYYKGLYNKSKTSLSNVFRKFGIL